MLTLIVIIITHGRPYRMIFRVKNMLTHKKCNLHRLLTKETNPIHEIRT